MKNPMYYRLFNLDVRLFVLSRKAVNTYCLKIQVKKNAKMLAESGYTYDKAIELLSLPDFEELKQVALEYIEHASSFAQIEKMQTSVFVSKSERMNKDWIQLWIQWVLFYVKNDRVNLPLEKKVKLYSILIENMDMLYRPVDLCLFMDKLYYDIRKAVI